MKHALLIVIALGVSTSGTLAQSGVCFDAKVAYEGAKGGLYPGTGTPVIPSTASLDFNKDGFLDLAAAPYYGKVSIFLTNGSSAFADTLNYTLSESPVSRIIPEDFNEDGHDDLLVTTYDGGFLSPDWSEIYVLLGNCAGGFSDPVRLYSNYGYYTSITFADFNNDNNVDIAVDFLRFYGNGDGTFWIPRSALSSAVADFNQDGSADLAAVYYANVNELFVFSGDGKGGLEKSQRLTVGTEPSKVISVDLNGDGWVDLATANKGSSTISVLLGGQSGVFAAASHYPVGLGTEDVLAGDFNKDGNTDLATANAGSNTLSLLIGDGHGGFADAIEYSVGNRPVALTSSDFNNDGSLDLAVANANDNTVAVLLNDQSGHYNEVSKYKLWSAGPLTSIVAGDLNQDGIVDLAVGTADVPAYWDPAEATLMILYGLPGSGFSNTQVYSAGYGQGHLVLVDVNKDGYPDIVANNQLFLGDRTHEFSASNALAAHGFVTASADFNGDAKPDLVAVGNNLTVFLNDLNDGLKIAADGPTTFCAGASVTLRVNSISTGQAFRWDPGNSTGDSLVVSATGTYLVTSTNENGCVLSSSEIEVTVIPLPLQPTAFTESVSDICAGQTDARYVVSPRPTESYDWSYSGTGATVKAENNLALVDFGSDATTGILSVTASNSCGISAPRTMSVTVSTMPKQPGDFTEGLFIVCQGQGLVRYEVPNDPGVTYTWIYPESEETSVVFEGVANSILAHYGDDATSGDLSVRGQNVCGYGEPRVMAVTVNSKPPKPIISADSLNTEAPMLTSSSSTGNQWYVDNTPILDETNSRLIITGPGVYALRVTIDGCKSELSADFPIIITGMGEATNASSLSLFPNPADRILNVDLSTLSADAVDLIIYSAGGIVMSNRKTTGGSVVQIDVQNYSQGVYLLLTRQGGTSRINKFIKH